MKQFLKKIFHRRKIIQVTPNSYTNLHVIEVETETTSITEGLGLSQERAEELVKITIIEFSTCDNIVDAAVKASKHCKHANELFFISTVIVHKQRDLQDPIGNILRGMRKD